MQQQQQQGRLPKPPTYKPSSDGDQQGDDPDRCLVSGSNGKMYQQDQQQQQQQQPNTGGGSSPSNSSSSTPNSEGDKPSPNYYELPSSNLGEIDDKWQLLRMECISQTETRRLLACLDIAFRLSVAAFIAYLVLRFKALPDGRMFFCTTTFSQVNLGVACVLLPITWSTAGWTLLRCFDSWASHKKWSERRKRLVIIYGIQLAAATIGLTCYLLSNALVVSSLSCGRYDVRSAIYWLSFIRWSCWNTTFLMITIRAHSTTIVLPSAATASRGQLFLLALGLPSALGIGTRRGSRNTSPSAATADSRVSNGVAPQTGPDPAPADAGNPHQQQQQQQSRSRKSLFKASLKRPSDMLVLDLPWMYHWPKMLLWVTFEACHAALASLEDQQKQSNCQTLSESCDLHSCPAAGRSIGLLTGEIAASLLYFAVWVWLMLRSGRLLRSRPWQEFRVANLIFRLERRLGIWAYNLIVLASVIFWFAGLADCSRAAFQYHGLPTTEMMWCCISVIGMLMIQPHNPHQANPRLISQLQEFAWTEAELPDRIKARNAHARGKLDRQPMFCFETAIKCFFWSCLVYEEYEGALSSPAGAAAAVTEGELEQLMKGLALYDLKVHKVVYDLDGELKILFAWNESTVLISFRGSTTAANWVADAMLWRSAHPGSQLTNKQAAWFGAPKIHSGFLRCWSGTGLDVRVMGMLTTLVDTSLVDKKQLKFYFTGHSLGGAVATLAALDLVKKYPEIDAVRQISVYTYGAPRVGNHAFAKRYEAQVPDTWHVINDQDTIPRGGKFISAYKRNGQRVIMNQAGDLVVRPVPLESSLLQMALGSNPLHHLLSSYQGAMTAVALGQLDRLKSLPGGPEGLVNLVKDCPIIAENMYQYGNKQNLILWVGSRVLYTLNSRAPREALTLRRLAAENARAAKTGGGQPSLDHGSSSRRRQQRQTWRQRRQQRIEQARAAKAAAAAGGGTRSDQVRLTRGGTLGDAQHLPDLEMGLGVTGVASDTPGGTTSDTTRSDLLGGTASYIPAGTTSDTRGGNYFGSRIRGAALETVGLAAVGLGGLWQLVTQPVGELVMTFTGHQQQQEHRQQQQQQQQRLPSVLEGSREGWNSTDGGSSSSRDADLAAAAAAAAADQSDIQSDWAAAAAAAGRNISNDRNGPHQPVNAAAASAGAAAARPRTAAGSSSSDPFGKHAREQLAAAQQQAAADRLAGPIPSPFAKALDLITGITPDTILQGQQQKQKQPDQQQQHQQQHEQQDGEPGQAAVTTTAAATTASMSRTVSAWEKCSDPGTAAVAAAATSSVADATAAAATKAAAASGADQQMVGNHVIPGLATLQVGAEDPDIHAAAASPHSSSSSTVATPFASPFAQQASSSSSPFSAAAAAAAPVHPTTAASAIAADLDSPAAAAAVAAAAAMDHRISTSSTASITFALDRLQFEDPVATRSPSLLLQPAHSAPQALLNPNSVLSGIQTENNTESDKSDQGITGMLEDLSERVGEMISGSVTSRRAKHKWRGALGMMGLSSSKDANAGTSADAQGDSASSNTAAASDSSSSSSKKHHPLHAILHPRSHHHLKQQQQQGSSSTGGIKPSGSSSPLAAAAAPAGSSSPDDALNQRHLISLDVRRLSLAAPISTGVHTGAAVQTQVHLPVLQEHSEELML